MKYLETRKELVHISRMVQAKGYTQASGGNLSCRVRGTDLFAIKKTAVNMSEMTEADVLIVDQDGAVVDGDGKPSKEVNFHLGIMKIRRDVNAVVHCHPNFSIAFANCELELPHTTVTSKKNVGRIPWVETAPPGSEELKNNVLEAFMEYPDIKGILMKEHGICTVGSTLLEAYNRADIIEQTAKQAYLVMEISKNRDFFADDKGG